MRDLLLDNTSGRFVFMKPWKQNFDLQGHAPPRSTVRDIQFERIRGRYGILGSLEGNPGQTTIDGITLRDIDLHVSDTSFTQRDIKHLRFENVRINGAPFSPTL